MANLVDNPKYYAFKNKLPKSWQHRTDPLPVKFPVDGKWTEAKHKVLIIVEHVDGLDLHKKQLLTHPYESQALISCVKLGRKYAKDLGASIPDSRFAVANFNSMKTYTLGKSEYKAANEYQAKRVREIIDKLGPDQVWVFGRVAGSYLVGHEVHHRYGRVESIKTDNKEYQAVCLPSLEKLYAGENDNLGTEDFDKINLIGYVGRCLSSAFLGYQPYSAKDIEVNSVYVDNLSKFDGLMEQLENSEKFALDLETKNLTNFDNGILTFQFALDSKTGYVIPFEHKDTPFGRDDLNYIRERLQKLFARRMNINQKFPPHIVGHGLKFDLRVLRQQLGIPNIDWPIWDTIAGEYCLDENMKALGKNKKDPVWGLSNLLSRYGNDFYSTAEVSKAERAGLAQRDLDDEVIAYCAMDVQAPFRLSELQSERAKGLSIGGKSYEPYHKRLVLNQLSDMIHVMSIMEHRGAHIDMVYIMEQMAKTGSLRQRIKEIQGKFKDFKSVKKANKILLERKKIPDKGLWGKTNKFIFDITKNEHQKVLFLEVLGLEPINHSNKTGAPSVDKEFKEAYKDQYEEVALFDTMSHLEKLYDTFVKGIYKKMAVNPDSKRDHRLRPSFGFQNIVTGRSNCTNPNLQQIPTRSKEAKYIKREFVAPPKKLTVKMDYATHEVRVWGLISGDLGIAKMFEKARRLITKYRFKPTPENYEKMDKEGDIHRINYNLFTGTPIHDITSEQRQSSKGLTFGSIYGMAENSMADDLGISVDEVSDLLKRFFQRAPKAAKWLEWAKKFSKKNLYVYSPLGRRRNLFAYMLELDQVTGAMERRSTNSPIQGLASDMGFTASRLLHQFLSRYAEDNGLAEGAWIPFDINVMVHDSIEAEAPYEYIPLLLHAMEYWSTIGVRDRYKQVYGFNFVVDLGVDFEIGASNDSLEEWDGLAMKDLKGILRNALQYQKENLAPKDERYDIDPETVYSEIAESQKQLKPWLDEHMPLELTTKPKTSA